MAWNTKIQTTPKGGPFVSMTGGGNQTFYGIDANGYVWGWGLNTTNQATGDNTGTNRSTPSSFNGAANKKLNPIVCGGSYASTGLDASSYAWGWGVNTYGQVGDNSNVNRGVPVSVVGGKQWKAIAASNQSVYGLDSSGYAWGWGQNSGGVLCDQTIIHRSSPVSVVGAMTFRAIACGNSSLYAQVLALDNSSYAWTWGSGTLGQIGNNLNVSVSSPTSVVGGRQWIAIACGQDFMMALDASSYAWGWGYNNVYQLGHGTNSNRSSPTSVMGTQGIQSRGIQFVALWKGCPYDSSYALDEARNLWAWGNKAQGQFGNNTASGSQSAPVLAISTLKFKELVAGLQNCIGLDTSSVAWGWGTATNGCLGNGATTNKSTPSVAVNKSARTKNIYGRSV